MSFSNVGEQTPKFTVLGLLAFIQFVKAWLEGEVYVMISSFCSSYNKERTEFHKLLKLARTLNIQQWSGYVKYYSA